MDIGSLLRSMRNRMPWPVGQKVLLENELPRGRGWDKTVERLSEESKCAEKFDVLSSALKEHLLCGEKLVRYFHVDKSAREEIAVVLEKAKIPSSDFRTAYPLILSEDKLSDQPTEPTLVAVEADEHSVSAIFSSVRSFISREIIPRSRLPKQVSDALNDYAEIVGVRHVHHQAVDVVTIPRSSPYVSIRVDFPNGMHRDVGEAAQARILNKFLKLLQSDDGAKPINLFPLISLMYSDANEGAVVELAFGTTTASLKHEKMRRRSFCLRREAYHKGGKAALEAPIEPYRLSIVWKRPLTKGFSAPELSLNSTSFVAGSTAPVLTDAVIRNCMGINDFSYVEQRIKYHLGQLKRKQSAS